MFLSVANIPAIYDAWMVGDSFFGEIIETLFEMRTAALLKNQQPPYIYDMYNVFAYVPSRNIGAKRSIARIFNALAEGLNNRIRLPRFLLVIIDCDIIEDINLFDYGASSAIFKEVEWFNSQHQHTSEEKMHRTIGCKA